MNQLLVTAITIAASVIGAIVGAIVQGILTKDKQDYVDKQLNFNEIHLQQSNIVNNITVNHHVHKKEKRISNGASSEDNGILYLFGILIVGAFLIWGYLKYKKVIIIGLLIAAMFLETMSLTAAYVNIKKGIRFDKKMQSVLLYNLVSVMLIPFLLYFSEYPIVGVGIDKNAIYEMMVREGIMSVIKNMNIFFFLLYQVIGLIIVIIYIAHTFLGELHIWSMINLYMQTKGEKIWNFFYSKTYTKCRNNLYYIMIGSLWLILSFLMISGFLISWIMKI